MEPPKESSTAGQKVQPHEHMFEITMSEKERMEKQQPSFSQLDADGNNSISKEEAQAFDALALHFRQLDQNKDGKVDPDEFLAFKAMQMRGFDHGGDSTVQYGEHGAPPHSALPEQKESAAGQEIQPSEKRTLESMQPPGESRAAGQKVQPHEHMFEITMSEKERMEKQQPSFSQLDADGNNSISKEEAQAFDALALHFRQLDRNKDGKVDPDEFLAFKAMQMRGFDHGGDSTVQYGEHGAPPHSALPEQKESAAEQPSKGESEKMERQQ
ncbi:EF-hand domain-containing protein [Nitrosococcus halophilus]|nr:EF-hand domain-containing protein [Nitrosococcus halophilus]